MTGVDLLVTGIGELATLRPGRIPRVGSAASELGRIEHAALAVRGGAFVSVGPERLVRRSVHLRKGGTEVDAAGGTVVPGFVDAHTHVLYAGDRAGELEQKIRGESYLEIAAAGGGLFRTVPAHPACDDADPPPRNRGPPRPDAPRRNDDSRGEERVRAHPRGELRLLGTIPALAAATGVDLVPTYLGAHAIPPERANNPDGYVEEMVRRTIPEVARRRLAEFVDVFCEPGFFTPSQSERLLRAASAFGLGTKIHADEFVYSGGAALAAHLGTRSAEHLLTAPADDRAKLARAGVTAVLLPVTPFASFSPLASPGREMVDAGVPVALGTDVSANSPVESMPLVISHAVYSSRLTPAEALTGATVNAAHAVGAAERAGTIAAGRSADFVLFDVPSADRIAYRIGSIPTSVFRRGKYVSSA